MSLNIKNEETHRLSRELAAITGESMTEAITEAVRERLAHVQAELDKTKRIERLRAIAHECAIHMKEPYRSIDHADLLYDELGLPK